MSFGQDDEIVSPGKATWGMSDETVEAPKGASSLPTRDPNVAMWEAENLARRKKAPAKDDSFVGLLKEGEDWVKGGGEALLSLGTGALSMFGAAGSIVNEKIKGNKDPAEKIYTDFIERNTYQPKSEQGQAIMEPIGEAINRVGIPMAGLGRFPTRPVVGTKLPPVAETSIQKAIREAKKEATKPQEQGTLFVDPRGEIAPELPVKITESPEVVALAKKRARELEMEAKGLSDTMYVDPKGVATKKLSKQIKEEPGVVEAVKREQAQELQNTAREMELPKGEQLDLFQPEQRALAFEFGKADEVVKPAPEAPAKVIEPPKATEVPGDVWYTGSPEPLMKTRSLEEQSLRPNANEQKAGPGHYITMSRDMAGTYGGKTGSIYKVNKPFENAFDLNKVDPTTRISNETRYNQLVEQLGSRSEANKALKAEGYDAIRFTNARGEQIANIFNPAEVKVDGPSRVSSTLSGPLELLPLEERPVRPDTIKAPSSPQMLEAKAVEQKKVETLSRVLPESVLKEWMDVNTREEAFHLAKDAKDIGGASLARDLASGIQGVTITSGNNPVLKYVRKVMGDARAEMTKFSQEYITNKETGLVTRIQKLTPDEKVGVMEALMESDKQQHRVTRATMDLLKFSEEQKAFIEQFQKTADAVFQMWNDVRKELGFKDVPYREGWFPGVFKGSYKTLVTNAKGEIIGMIASDTKWQQKKAREWYSKKHPDAQFSSTARADLGKAKVDFFSGLNDVLAILAKGDPKMAQLLEASREAQKLANNDLFSIGAHELQKKGIIGNEGNRPWLDKKQNAKDALKAMVDYFEQAAEHHALQKPLHEIDVMMKADDTAHMPNVREYLQKYADHVTGKTGDVGRAINQAIDIPFKLAGVSSSIPIKVANTIKAGMGRLYMGYWNPAFVASQLAQPFQLAHPLASMFAERLGLPQYQVMATMGRGSLYATSETLAAILKSDKVSIAPDHIKTAIKYAHDRGLYAFNDLELAQSATKNKIVRAHNTIADLMIGAGDRMTKLPTFLGFVEMFKEAGIETPIALRLAEKATETSMINYHPWERPMVYNKLGVMGQFAGGLTTYKHGSINALTAMAKEAKNKKNIKPIALAAMSMLLFAGITGVPAYQELDALYSKLSELAKGKPGNIREDFLQNLPEYLNSGVVSTASNLNMQAKWSAADMVPDSLGKAASPHLEGAAQIAAAAAEYAKDPSEINRNNLLLRLTPSGMKGFTEEALMKDEKGRVLGKDGLPKMQEPRSEEDWQKRKWAGVGLLNESIESQDLYKDRTAQTFQERQIADLAKKVKSAFTGNEIARTKLLIQEYKKLAGPEATQALIDSLVKVQEDKQKGERERRQGIPTNLRSVEKWKEYNDGN